MTCFQLLLDESGNMRIRLVQILFLLELLERLICISEWQFTCYIAIIRLE